MEEFLPLLIGIIWLVYTLYNRGQKKKNLRKPQPAEKQENKSPSFIEQLLMGEDPVQSHPLESEEYEVEEEPILEEIVKIKKDKETPKPFLQEELAGFMMEGQSISSDFEIADVEDEKNIEFSHETDEFDLKKAVIFSEILNAPYIDYK